VQRPADERKGSPGHHWQDYDKIKQQVVEILAQHPEGMTGAKIAEKVSITQGAMSKYLSMLSVDGIIMSRKIGVAKLWKLVSSADRSALLADKMTSETVNFKDYALSLIENNGRLFDPDNKRILAMPTILLVSLYKHTKSILGSEVHAFFYEWGRTYAHETRELVRNMAEKTGITFIEAFISILKLKGWGKFEIQLNEKSISVVWHDSIWSEMEPREDHPVDDFMVGALTEAAKLSFGGNWQFGEVDCKSTGAHYCKFVGNHISTDPALG
jgi:predicted hydrocarbon binding protein